MENVMSVTGWICLVVTVLFTIQPCYSQFNFRCLDTNGEAPALPKAYSTNIRINFLYEEYTMEVKYATIGESDKELIEIKTKDKHAKYITRGEKNPALYIEYRKDAHPVCKITDASKLFDMVDDDFAGKNRIFLKAAEVMMFPDSFDLYSVGPYTDIGVYAQRFEGCISEPKVNISMAFAATNWGQSHVSALYNATYPVMATADIGNIHMIALYSNFDPTMPDDAVFQPPEDVYCEGLGTDRKPPKMPDYFSYNSEVIVYENAEGIAPIVSQRMVYYDYPAGISRMDFYDPLAEYSDLFSVINAESKSMIHDYNAGVQYIFNTFTGQCMVDKYQVTPSVISFLPSADNKMLNGDAYFLLDNAKTSYNGQYPVNGIMADIYTARKKDPKTKESVVISWAFSTKETRIVENESVDKNVLLRMCVRPETDLGYDGIVQINFYNFVREEPKISTYDVTNCYDDSNSKILVFTFPAYDSLKGSKNLIGMMTHLAIKTVTGIRVQRIYMKEVIFSGKYIYAEFTLLEDSSVKGEKLDKISLDEALAKLKEAISDGSFIVNVPDGKNQTITLKPEPNGLNVFAGDRSVLLRSTGYKQGSVIGLTIGILLLGFVLGGVTLNLIMSKKFGVSLFQKSRFDHTQFDNPLNESSM